MPFFVYQLHFSEVGGKKRKKKHKKEEVRRGICGESGYMTREDLVVAEIFLGLVNILQVGSQRCLLTSCVILGVS